MTHNKWKICINIKYVDIICQLLVGINKWSVYDSFSGVGIWTNCSNQMYLIASSVIILHWVSTRWFLFGLDILYQKSPFLKLEHYLSAYLLQIEYITIGMAVISLLTQVQITLKDVMVWTSWNGVDTPKL